MVLNIWSLPLHPLGTMLGLKKSKHNVYLLFTLTINSWRHEIFSQPKTLKILHKIFTNTHSLSRVNKLSWKASLESTSLQKKNSSYLPLSRPLTQFRNCPNNCSFLTRICLLSHNQYTDMHRNRDKLNTTQQNKSVLLCSQKQVCCGRNSKGNRVPEGKTYIPDFWKKPDIMIMGFAI